MYRFWYNAPTLLSTGATVVMELVPYQPWQRSAAVSVHYTKTCIYSQNVLRRMGEFVAETCRVDLKRLLKERVVASC